VNTATTYVTQAVDKHSAKITDLSDRLLWVAGLLAFVALVYWLMWRAWRKRAARQSDLPELPEIPADLGEPLLSHPSPTTTLSGGGKPPLLTMSGRYHASTTAGDWLDRIAARGLGTRSLVDLTLTEQGVAVHRPAAADFLIPAAALRGARLDKGIAGKVVPEGGLLVITWQHGDRLIDSGFRSEHPAEHPAWVTAITNLNTTKEGAR
jgi:hypothetical protein